MAVNAPILDQTVNDVDLALARATLYSALALGFRSPTEETLKRLGSKDAMEALSDAARVLDENSAVCSAIHDLFVRGQSLATLSASYASFFGHTARGRVSPYETEYGAAALFQQPHDLGDLNGFYLAFGLKVNADEHERADHISCECEFLSFLALKEAYALEKGDIAMLEEVHKATRLILQDHLARFVPAFARRLGSEDAGGFYGALGNFCLRFVTQECRRLDVPLGLESLGLRAATDDGVPMACGDGRDCVAMPGAFNPDAEEYS